MEYINIDEIATEDIKCYRIKNKRKTSTSIDNLFEAGYSGLNSIITLNIKGNNKRAKKLYDEWLNSPCPQEYIVKLNIEGKNREFKVAYRTNMQPNKVIKQPNMLHLMQDEQTKLVLRRPKTYSKEQLQFAESSFRFDLDNSLHMGGFLENDNFAYHIPEEIATEALEFLYSEGYPRVTPHYKIIEEKSKTFYLRKWMSEPVKDIPLNPKTVGEHIGFLQSLGIVSRHDRQYEHYFVENNNNSYIVNIDPDFFVWIPQFPGNDRFTTKPRYHNEDSEEYREEMIKDEEDFRDLMSGNNNFFNIENKNYELYKKTRDEYLINSEELSLEFKEIVNNLSN